MKLILDPGDYLFDIFLQGKPLSDKLAVNSLRKIYNDLLGIQDEILSSIDEIIFINSSGELKGITTDIYSVFLKSIKKKSKKTKYLFMLFNNTGVINFFKHEDKIDFLSNIVFNWKDSEFIFFDNLLTNSTAKLLRRCSNVSGYRKVNKDSEYIWQEIENVEKYLIIADTLFLKFVGLEVIKKNYIDISKAQRATIIEGLKSYSNIKDYNLHVFRFKDSESDDLKNFLNTLIDDIGYFKTHFCKIDGKNIPENEERLIIMDIELLEEADRLKILEKISEDKYLNSLIIIIVENKFELKGFPKINYWMDFSSEDMDAIENVQLTIINDRIKILDNKINEYRNIISSLYTDEKEKNRSLQMIDKFSKGDDIINPDAVNFWYDIDSVELKNSENVRKTTEEWKKLLYGEKKIIHYKIELDENRDIWIIKKNNIQLKKTIQFSGSKV